jgi:hypothetical protein
MPTNTYVALRTEVLTSAVPSVTFNLSGITGYTDLVLVITPQASVSTNLQMRFNGSSAAYYSNTGMRGWSGGADSYRQTNLTSLTLTTVEDIGNPNTNIIIQIPNYSNTTTFKTVLTKSNQATSGTEAIVGLWRGTTGSDTPAITSITLLSGGGNLLTGSTFTIYGIAATSVGAKATGGTIYTDSQYFYHAFTSNGTFTPTQSISADVLVVAGGGGGGDATGGGGGAGGVCYQVGRSLTTSGLSVTVGGGGARVPGAIGATGGNSTFDTITANGGGGGNYGPFANGANGGSGGGGGEGRAGGSATQGTSGGATGYGNAGGAGNNASPYLHGGGGGAGAVGNGGTGVSNGNGGAGLDTWSSWMTATGLGASGFIAGGGGGGTTSGTSGAGGAGGGGTGSTNTTASTAGAIYTGSGGGGGGNVASSAGGSGIVIIRYLKA